MSGLSLKGVIATKFGSVAELARSVGWSYAKTHRVVNFAQDPTLSDMKTLGAALGMTVEEVVSAFLLS